MCTHSMSNRACPGADTVLSPHLEQRKHDLLVQGEGQGVHGGLWPCKYPAQHVPWRYLRPGAP